MGTRFKFKQGSEEEEEEEEEEEKEGGKKETPNQKISGDAPFVVRLFFFA